MRPTGKRYVMSAGAVAAVIGGALALGSFTPASAGAQKAADVASVNVQQVTLRLAGDPGQVANVKGASTENGAPVIQWPWSGATNERWEAEGAGGGYRD